MSNEPKCVYIKTDVGYVQITYAEFCRIRNTTENYKASHWFIPVQGVLLEVPKDAYKAFYREKERERYLRKLDSALFLCNLDLKSEEISLRDENTDIEQQTEDRLMIEKMYSCLHYSTRTMPNSSVCTSFSMFPAKNSPRNTACIRPTSAEKLLRSSKS